MFRGGFPGFFQQGGDDGDADDEVDTTSLYEVMGLKKGCSQEEIKKAYRTLSLKHHPDRPGGST
jgi:DnaJ homolog subfamily A member 2